jgi:hypothetical protein
MAANYVCFDMGLKRAEFLFAFGYEHDFQCNDRERALKDGNLTASEPALCRRSGQPQTFRCSWNFVEWILPAQENKDCPCMNIIHVGRIGFSLRKAEGFLNPQA